MNNLTIFDATESAAPPALVEIPALPAIGEILAEVLTPADRALMAKVVAEHAKTRSDKNRTGQAFIVADSGDNKNVEEWQRRMLADFDLEIDFVAMRGALGKKYERAAVAWLETQRQSWVELAQVVRRMHAKIMEHGRARAAAERHNAEVQGQIYSPSRELQRWINPANWAEMATRLTAHQFRSPLLPVGVQAVEMLTPPPVAKADLAAA